MKKTTLTISALIITTIFILVAAYYPRTVVINTDKHINNPDLHVTLLTNDGQVSHPISKDGLSTIGHGLFSHDNGIMAVHDTEFMYWEGAISSEQSITLQINYSEKRPLSSETQKHLQIHN